MKTIRLEEPGRFADLDTPVPAGPIPGEALVRVHRVGVCGTDLHAYLGEQPFFSYPRVLGHEIGVEVLEIGEGVSGIRPGDRCAVEPYINCMGCAACRRGKPNCCSSLKVLGVHMDGGMRSQFTVPARKLHSSGKLTMDQLALIETLAIGCHAVERARLEAGETALVVGAGPIGLSVMQFAKAAGARVIVQDVNPARIEFCRRELGIIDTIDAAREDPTEALRRFTEGDMPTAVFDATGNPKSMSNAFAYAAHGGRIVFVGLFQGSISFDDPGFHKRELTLLGSRNALPADFAKIIGLVERDVIDTAPWISHRSTLSEVARAFPSWVGPDSGVIKAMIEV